MNALISHAPETSSAKESSDSNGVNRFVAITTVALAAALAIFELGLRSSTTIYLTRQIEVTDAQAILQDVQLSRSFQRATERILSSLPNAKSAAVQAAVAAERAERQGLEEEDMRRMLAEINKARLIRDRAAHRAHGLEATVGGLQLAIVLVSAATLSRKRLLIVIGTALAAVSALYGCLIWTGIA
jgi:hypothetical protein